MKKDKCSYKIFLYSVSSIILTIALSYTAQYYYDKHLLEGKNKKELQLLKIEHIDKQLDQFYIPLKIKLLKSEKLWLDYKERYGDSEIFTDIANDVSSNETKKWQIYMLQVFQPIHVEMSNIVSSKRNLALKNKELDQELDFLIRHISYYKVIFSQWKDNDKTQNFASIHFPNKLISLTQTDIDTLKSNKMKLEQ